MGVMSQSGAGVGNGGVSMRTMSHKCGGYESEWSKCENGKKRVRV